MSSSRLNGADVSEDLSQLNGAVAAGPAQTLGNQNTGRVSSVAISVGPFLLHISHVAQILHAQAHTPTDRVDRQVGTVMRTKWLKKNAVGRAGL